MTPATHTRRQSGAVGPGEAARASLSVTCMTAGPAARVAAILSRVREVADEIVVALDDRAGGDVRDAMTAVADATLVYPYAEPVDRPVPWLHTQCKGDWVLTIDDDEVPSPDLVAALPDLIRDETVTHYWIPRRWLFPDPGVYLDEPPWLPDYQLRLVRNDQRLLRFSNELHRPLAVLGPARFLESPVWHLDCVVKPVEARREKARRYAQMRPGLRIGGRDLNAAYFLPELWPDARLAPVPTADRVAIDEVLAAKPPEAPGRAGPVRDVSREEIDRHWPGRPLGEDAYEADLELVHPVAPFTVEEKRPVDVRVTNRGDVVWTWGETGEPPIRLAARWVDAVADDATAVRTALPGDLAPGGTAIVPVHVAAPAAPGRFRLEIDLVHEHARWFGRAVSTEVDVRPRPRIAIVGGDEAAEIVLRRLERHPDVEPVLVARDEDLPWEPPGHRRVPGVRSYLFGGDPDQPGSLALGATVAKRGLALVRGKNVPPNAAALLDALAGCRLLVVAGLDAPPGAPEPRELARVAALISAARARGVPVAVHDDALPAGTSRAVRMLRRFVSKRATLVYTDTAELDRLLAA